MKTCAQCGFHHSDEDDQCVRCGAALDPLGEVDPLASPGQEDMHLDFMRPRRRGPQWPLSLWGAAARRLFIWRERLRSPLPEGIYERNPWVAGALGIVPGLGQLYNHQPRKGLLMALAVGILLALALVTFQHPFSNLILVSALAGVLYSLNDAFTTAKEINRDYLPWQHRVGFYFAWLLYLCMMAIAGQYLLARGHLLIFRHIAYDDMAPYLRKGERVAVDLFTLTYWCAPRVGDVVTYDPPALKMSNPGMTQGNNPGSWAFADYVINPKEAIERVVAGPGQTFERRGGVFYLDGRPVGPEGQPVVQSQLKYDFKITAPAEKYIILFTYTGASFEVASTQPSFFMRPPRLDDPDWFMSNWPEACLVGRDAIFGHARWVYQPPPARRKLK